MTDPTNEALFEGLQQFKSYVQQNFPYKATYYEGTLDPSASGAAAPVGAFYCQKDFSGSAVAFWVKSGEQHTAWKLIPIGASATLRHVQSAAIATWTIAHNFGYWPEVSVYTPGGIEVEAEVAHLSLDITQIRFASPQSGLALLK